MTGESVRRALRTFLITTIALFVPGLLGWLNEVTKWARDEGSTPFPDGRGLAFLGVSAIVAGVVAVVNLLWNVIEDASGHAVLRDVPDRGARGEGGYLRILNAGTWPVSIDTGTSYGASRDRTLPGKRRIRARRRM